MCRNTEWFRPCRELRTGCLVLGHRGLSSFLVLEFRWALVYQVLDWIANCELIWLRSVVSDVLLAATLKTKCHLLLQTRPEISCRCCASEHRQWKKSRQTIKINAAFLCSISIKQFGTFLSSLLKQHFADIHGSIYQYQYQYGSIYQKVFASLLKHNLNLYSKFRNNKIKNQRWNRWIDILTDHSY